MPEIESGGVALCARFSLATSRRGYCGPDGADVTLYRAITEGTDLAPAREALARFEALAPYLEAIGEKHGRDPFDRRVVEAYWIGNELLDGFERSDFATLLDRLVRRGLPRSLARRLADHLPARPIPHHAFHVAFVGVGNVTGHVPTTLRNMQACRPSWGTVTQIEDRSVGLDVAPLEWVAPRLVLGPPVPLRVPFDARLLPELRPGDTVALHWETPVLRLRADEAARLRRYTALALSAASESLLALGVLPRSETAGPAA